MIRHLNEVVRQSLKVYLPGWRTPPEMIVGHWIVAEVLPQLRPSLTHHSLDQRCIVPIEHLILEQPASLSLRMNRQWDELGYIVKIRNVFTIDHDLMRGLEVACFTPFLRLLATVGIDELLLGLFSGWLVSLRSPHVAVYGAKSTLGFRRPIVVVHWALHSYTVAFVSRCKDELRWIHFFGACVLPDF